VSGQGVPGGFSGRNIPPETARAKVAKKGARSNVSAQGKLDPHGGEEGVAEKNGGRGWKTAGGQWRGTQLEPLWGGA